MTETQKVVDTKKTPEPSAEKTPEKTTAEKTTAEKTTVEKTAEKNNVDAPMKKKLTILKRPSQPEVSPINPPSSSEQKNMVDKSELMSLGRAPTVPFSLEGELAKI